MARVVRHRAILTLVACLGLASSRVALAEEPVVYESLDDIDIGRVFLSPLERARLDSGAPPPVRTVEAAPAPVVKKKKKRRPAGYFVSSSGAAGVWSRRGFVAEGGVRDVTFPGAVKVVRGAETDDASDDAAGTDRDEE